MDSPRFVDDTTQPPTSQRGQHEHRETVGSETQTLSGRVLVLETHRRQGVVAVRSLGRRGLDVTAGSDRRCNAGGLSRYADRRFQYPSPLTDESAFCDALERELRERQYDMLLPLTAVSVPVVVENRDRLDPHTEIPFLPFDELDIGLDKYRTVEAAQASGVPVPETLAPESADPATVTAELEYPVVVKPRRGAGGYGVHVCGTDEELQEALESVRHEHGAPVVQEFVPNGGEFGVYSIYDLSSELAGVTVQRRLRTNPPGGGASTLRETVSRPDLVRLADDLFADLGWRGVAMAEFRIDPRDGRPKLLEINPRLWGSLALSVFAGVDFPYLLYQLATTGRCDRSLEYRVGVQARSLAGDIGHLFGRDDTWQAARELLAPAEAPRTYDVLSVSDPLPGAAHLFRSGVALLGP
jgi:predicted ATP-grasp superfamily ATP-dependent carboligase